MATQDKKKGAVKSDRLDEIKPIAYSIRQPSAIYSRVKEFNMSYYYKRSCETTILLGSSGYLQDEGNGLLAKIGLYQDWLPNVYTFTSVTTGTNTPYLPRFRFDHDFYLKVGESKQWVIPLGSLRSQSAQKMPS